MNREEAIKLLPIVKAFSEGKAIEFRNINFKSDWTEMQVFPSLAFECYEFRIKHEPKYRPFKDAEECWNEMLKHQPFGWVKYKSERSKYSIYCNVDNNAYFEADFDDYEFADGTPFGILEEE